MTSDDIAWGVGVTLKHAHELKDVLKRYPAPCEIQWGVATRLQERWPHLERIEAMVMADRLMDVVRTASSSTTTH